MVAIFGRVSSVVATFCGVFSMLGSLGGVSSMVAKLHSSLLSRLHILLMKSNEGE